MEHPKQVFRPGDFAMVASTRPAPYCEGSAQGLVGMVSKVEAIETGPYKGETFVTLIDVKVPEGTTVLGGWDGMFWMANQLVPVGEHEDLVLLFNESDETGELEFVGAEVDGTRVTPGEWGVNDLGEVTLKIRVPRNNRWRT